MSAIQGIEGVISQLQATAMSAKMQDMQPQPTVSFAGQLHAALDESAMCKPRPMRRLRNLPSVSRVLR